MDLYKTKTKHSLLLLAITFLTHLELVYSNSSVSKRSSICQEYNVCQASGVCYISAQRYKCKCPIGRFGQTCEESIDQCSLNPCLHGCQATHEFQFECLPLFKEGKVFEYKSTLDLLKPFDSNSSCDSFGLCLNGGRCYTGYRNPRSLIYKCFCQTGYAGLNCQLRHTFGHDSRSIFKLIKKHFDENHRELRQTYHNNYPYNRQEYFQTAQFKYSFIDGFGKTFLLLNTEALDDLTISRIEFHAAKSGKFIVSFVQVTGCNSEVQSCGKKLYELHESINNPSTDEKIRYKLSSELEKMLNDSESYLISAYEGFNKYDFEEHIQVSKGSVLCITQIDGRLGGLLSNEYHVSDLPDLMLVEKNLSNQLFTANISDYLPKNETVSGWFFSVLVSDTNLVNGTSGDNSKLTFKATSYQSTIANGLECVNALCLNGGVCVPLSLVDSYRCSCPNNTVGKHCEILVKSKIEALSTTTGVLETDTSTPESHSEYLETK